MHTADRSGSLIQALLVVAFCGAVGLAMVKVVAIDQVANGVHADSKHVEAPLIRKRHQAGLCHERKAYVSARRGTLLVLCKMDDRPTQLATWGGLVWRVLEYRHGSTTLLSPDDLYECTVYAGDWQYWQRVVQRDGYIKAHDTEWYGPLSWLISP